MPDRKIKGILVLANKDLLFEVGTNDVTKITDVGIEYPDSTYFIYDVHAGDKVVTRIENCPVVVEYE